MDLPQSAQLMDCRPLYATEMTCPVCIDRYTRFGPVTLYLFASVGFPWMDDVLILGCSRVEVLGLDIYAGLTEFVWRDVERRAKPVENVNYIACRRVSLTVETMQQQLMGGE